MIAISGGTLGERSLYKQVGDHVLSHRVSGAFHDGCFWVTIRHFRRLPAKGLRQYTRNIGKMLTKVLLLLGEMGSMFV